MGFFRGGLSVPLTRFSVVQGGGPPVCMIVGGGGVGGKMDVAATYPLDL